MVCRFLWALSLSPLLLILSSCAVTVVKIEGTAMEPAYMNGERVVVQKGTSQIDRLDVITFRYPKDPSQVFVKRVIGLPNETVLISEGRLMIDGKELTEPYVDSDHNLAGRTFAPVRVPPDSYYVLGDNRDNSSDSRYWGTVKTELIIGECLYKY